MKKPVLDAAWDAEVLALYRHDLQEIWDRSIAPHVWNQYHNQLAIYLDLADAFSAGAALRILDVGCAQGTLALLLAERGHSVVAMDLRQEFLDYARSRYEHGDIRFIQGNALKVQFEEEFDLIFANQIVEHLVYPDILLRGLREILVDKGRLVVTTPNWHYFVNRDLPSFTQLGDPRQHEHRQFTADGDGHFYAYRQDELTGLFAAGNFIDIQSRFFETPFVSGHLKFRHLHGIVPVPPLWWLDRFALALPGLARHAAHQLMVTGRKG